MLSFLREVSQFTPDPFPLGVRGDNRRLVAPFWADVDTNVNSGRVFHRETTDGSLLNRATQDVRDAFVNAQAFSAAWLFVTTWYNVTYFGGNSRTPVSLKTH